MARRPADPAAARPSGPRHARPSRFRQLASRAADPVVGRPRARPAEHGSSSPSLMPSWSSGQTTRAQLSDARARRAGGRGRRGWTGCVDLCLAWEATGGLRPLTGVVEAMITPAPRAPAGCGRAPTTDPTPGRCAALLGRAQPAGPRDARPRRRPRRAGDRRLGTPRRDARGRGDAGRGAARATAARAAGRRHVVLPGEVAVALRGGRTTREPVDAPPELATTQRGRRPGRPGRGRRRLRGRPPGGAAARPVGHRVRRASCAAAAWGCATSRAARDCSHTTERGRPHSWSRSPHAAGLLATRADAEGDPVLVPTDAFDAWTAPGPRGAVARTRARLARRAAGCPAWSAVARHRRARAATRSPPTSPARSRPRPGAMTLPALADAARRRRARRPAPGSRPSWPASPGCGRGGPSPARDQVGRRRWRRPRPSASLGLGGAGVVRRGRCSTATPPPRRPGSPRCSRTGHEVAGPGRPDGRRARPARDRGGPRSSTSSPTSSRGAGRPSTASRRRFRPSRPRRRVVGPGGARVPRRGVRDRGAAAAALPGRRHRAHVRHASGSATPRPSCGRTTRRR